MLGGLGSLSNLACGVLEAQPTQPPSTNIEISSKIETPLYLTHPQLAIVILPIVDQPIEDDPTQEVARFAFAEIELAFTYELKAQAE